MAAVEPCNRLELISVQALRNRSVACSFLSLAPASPMVFAMCLGSDGELEGQVSINELLVAMGEPPVVPFPLTAAPDDVSSLFDRPEALPGL